MIAPVLLATALALGYLAAEPSSADLAAQTFRAELFADHGFAIWNNLWYGGHYLPSYSLLFPPLGAALGPRLAMALSAVAAVALFALLARRRYGDRALLGALWFALGSSTLLLTGRATFALGIAVGLGALVALERRRDTLAALLAVGCAIASPVAGLFLAIAGGAAATAGGRRGGLAVAAAAMAAVALISFAFPTGGREPFVFTAFMPVPLLAAAALLLLPRSERALRHGVVLYLLVATAVYVIPGPVGGTATRLGSLFAGPVLALALAGRRATALAVVALPLLYWQWVAPVRDVSTAAGDPSTEASFHQPLIDRLDSLAAGGGTAGPTVFKVEVPATRNRWEAAYVAERFPIARGWLRQVEWDDRDRFTGGRLTPGAYRGWLARNGVGYVAVADAKTDYLARDEVALVESGLPYLDEVWSNDDWRLYRVRGANGLVAAPGRMVAVEPDSFTLSAPRPGSYAVRLRYTRYWHVTGGDACVERDGDWTAVEVRDAGLVEVEASFSIGRMIDGDGSCSA